MHCRDWLAQLEQHQEELREAGLQIVAVGQGETKHAQRYCGSLAPSIECLTDKTTEPYHTYGLRRGTVREGAANSLALLKASLQAAARGHLQGKATGDVQMLPGSFIIDKDGRICYTYYSKHAGDQPAFDALIRVAHEVAKA
jgi:peroxiredoxin